MVTPTQAATSDRRLRITPQRYAQVVRDLFTAGAENVISGALEMVHKEAEQEKDNLEGIASLMGDQEEEEQGAKDPLNFNLAWLACDASKTKT